MINLKAAFTQSLQLGGNALLITAPAATAFIATLAGIAVIHNVGAMNNPAFSQAIGIPREAADFIFGSTRDLTSLLTCFALDGVLAGGVILATKSIYGRIYGPSPKP